ncbi:hypothetical protein H0G86_005829 [Trichoderma simmonsii]|uniref:LrgB-like protein n=2 Tax=Trichoderma simmonsii TaxID=1491479 RepID=A0A8G0LFD1_9HYPO|nr:hypothetical protein H0G86_005829 [Trichoderma simmonsii]
MAESSIWRLRWNRAIAQGAGYMLVAIICLASELLIWGLSRTLAAARLEFFSTIVGMAVLFALSTASWVMWKKTDDFYRRWLKTRVDFINAHLGVGFSVPMIMLDQEEMLNGGEIGRVIGSFLATNIVSWVAVFLLSVVAIDGVAKLTSQSPSRKGSICSKKSIAPSSTDDGVSSAEFEDDAEKKRARCSQDQETSNNEHPDPYYHDESSSWGFFTRHFPILLSLTLVFLVGIPLTITMHEERFFDGFTLWFIWISSVRSQRAFKKSQICTFSTPLKRGLATLMNPVLLTTLFMTGYTRAKASILGSGGLARTLKKFSGGSPIYALWTASIGNTPLPNNPSGWYGAGDAALSILECGILVWGFKLSECRRQIFSTAGLLAIILCTIAAAANTFLSVLVSRAIGLHAFEALSFAARSTTLALAKPATEAIGGNSPVNAMLVVSNGILGQLVYPFVLDKLGVSKQDGGDIVVADTQESVTDESTPIQALSSRNPISLNTNSTSIPAPLPVIPKSWHQNISTADSPVTVAAGIAIGINGAAMGVSYLYETRSRAAPYAALSMMVFGVMTVVFTTVEPFKSTLISLASR